MDVHTLWHWWFLRIQWLGNYPEARGEIRRNNRGWLRLSDKSSLLAKVSTIYLKLLCILHPPSFIPLGGAFFCVVLSLRIQQSWEGVKPNTSPAIGFGENLLSPITINNKNLIARHKHTKFLECQSIDKGPGLALSEVFWVSLSVSADNGRECEARHFPCDLYVVRLRGVVV